MARRFDCSRGLRLCGGGMAVYAVNRVNAGGNGTAGDMLAWGREKLNFFHLELKRLGKEKPGQSPLPLPSFFPSGIEKALIYGALIRRITNEDIIIDIISGAAIGQLHTRGKNRGQKQNDRQSRGFNWEKVIPGSEDEYYHGITASGDGSLDTRQNYITVRRT